MVSPNGLIDISNMIDEHFTPDTDFRNRGFDYIWSSYFGHSVCLTNFKTYLAGQQDLCLWNNQFDKSLKVVMGPACLVYNKE